MRRSERVTGAQRTVVYQRPLAVEQLQDAELPRRRTRSLRGPERLLGLWNQHGVEEIDLPVEGLDADDRRLHLHPHGVLRRRPSLRVRAQLVACLLHAGASTLAPQSGSETPSETVSAFLPLSGSGGRPAGSSRRPTLVTPTLAVNPGRALRFASSMDPALPSTSAVAARSSWRCRSPRR